MATTDSDTQPSGTTPGGADDARSKVWHVLDSYGVEEENIPGAETNLVNDILAVAGRAETTTEYRARFSYPSSVLGPTPDSYGPPRATLSEALADRVPRSEETHGWHAGVQTREVTDWTETP